MSAQFEIVVRVPAPQRNLVFFLVRESEDFKAISIAVAAAAATAKLQMEKAVDSLKEPNFIDVIYNKIRAARLIVADCSSDPKTGQPNPNVMYEVGFADSIGKPVLILTRDPRKLPSDIRMRTVLTYEPGQETDEAFLLKLRLRLRELMSFESPNTNLLDGTTEVYSLVLPILSFAKQAHHELQSLDAGHLDQLLRKIHSICGRSWEPHELFRAQLDWVSWWEEYALAYDAADQRTLQGMRDSSPSALTNALNQLGEAVDPQSADKARSFCQKIRMEISKYHDIHKGISKVIDATDFADAAQSLKTQETSGNVFKLSQISKRVIVFSDKLIVNMIDILPLKRDDQ